MFNILSSKKYSMVNTKELAELLRRAPKNVSFVDVREQDEWDEGHIELFQHIPLGTLDNHVEELKKCEQVYFLCRSGGRSSQACARLVENGYDNAVNISGGINSWKDQNLPLEN